MGVTECYSPIHGFKGPVKENGRRDVIFRAPAGTERMTVPCGHCLGCRMKYSREWAIRCMHESQMHERNCFVTLTYDDAHYPKDGSLQKGDFQKFMKRLRREYVRWHDGKGLRYFHCGEYGDRFARPHYHALLFGVDFDDKVLFRTRDRNSLYTSAALRELWPLGHSLVGEVTFASASYVTRYCVKKVVGEKSDEHYCNHKTGVLLQPEYTTMSRRPGIGAGWFEKFKSDVFPSDNVVVGGWPMKPPRFYDNLLAKEDEDLLAELKLKRMEHMGDLHERSQERLSVKEFVRTKEMMEFKRLYEEGVDR